MQKKPLKYNEIISKVVKPSERFKIISEDPYVVEGRLMMPYRYFAGTIGTKFFNKLKEEKKILGIKCPDCNTIYVPPRPTCGRCFTNLEEWVEVANTGTVLSYTVTYYPLPIHPVAEPLVYGIIQLDGADTGLTHIIGETNPSQVHIGMRVEAVFKEQREGNILDLKYFRPL